MPCSFRTEQRSRLGQTASKCPRFSSSRCVPLLSTAACACSCTFAEAVNVFFSLLPQSVLPTFPGLAPVKAYDGSELKSLPGAPCMAAHGTQLHGCILLHGGQSTSS